VTYFGSNIPLQDDYKYTNLKQQKILKQPHEKPRITAFGFGGALQDDLEQTERKEQSQGTIFW
jgi:hypothetical protein